MLIKKITTGFVIQTFDTDKKNYVSQEFIAGDSEYEDTNGDSVNFEEIAEYNFGPGACSEPYLPFDMAQPQDMLLIREAQLDKRNWVQPDRNNW